MKLCCLHQVRVAGRAVQKTCYDARLPRNLRAPQPQEEVVEIAVLTFDGFNELDSFVPAAILNRMRAKGWNELITAPIAEVTSMNGVTVQRQRPLEFTNQGGPSGAPT